MERELRSTDNRVDKSTEYLSDEDEVCQQFEQLNLKLKKKRKKENKYMSLTSATGVSAGNHMEK